MIRLDRSQVRVPESWAGKVESAFPDIEAFRRKAAEFEALHIDDPVRRKGFTSFAEEVLPKVGGKRKFRPFWCQAKDALAEMSHCKCAYCEIHIGGKRAAQVEHFQPKSLFPSRSYDWANYLLRCADCNGTKGDQWPTEGGSFVRPDGEEDPAVLFEFLDDGSIQEVEEGSSAASTILAFGLNRKWLCEGRAYEISWILGEVGDLAKRIIPDEEVKRQGRRTLVRISDPRHRYSAALTQCFLRAWAAKNLPDLGL